MSEEKPRPKSILSEVLASVREAAQSSRAHLPPAYVAPTKIDILDNIAESLREHHPGLMTEFAANHLAAVSDHLGLMEEVRVAAQSMVSYARSCMPTGEEPNPYVLNLENALKAAGRAA